MSLSCWQIDADTRSYSSCRTKSHLNLFLFFLFLLSFTILSFPVISSFLLHELLILQAKIDNENDKLRGC